MDFFKFIQKNSKAEVPRYQLKFCLIAKEECSFTVERFGGHNLISDIHTASLGMKHTMSSINYSCQND